MIKYATLKEAFMHSISNFLISTDVSYSYTPVVSALTNLTNLFFKCVVLPFLSHHAISQNRYFTYAQEKSFFRCVALAIPILGNLLVYLFDKIYPESRQVALMRVAQDGMTLQHTVFRNDLGIVLAAVQQNGLALEFASQELKNNRDIVLAAVQQNGRALGFASEDLQNNYNVILAAVQRDSWAARWLVSGIR